MTQRIVTGPAGVGDACDDRHGGAIAGGLLRRGEAEGTSGEAMRPQSAVDAVLGEQVRRLARDAETGSPTQPEGAGAFA